MARIQEKNYRSSFEQNTRTTMNASAPSEFGIKNPKVRKVLRLFLKLFIILPMILFVITVILIVNSTQKLTTYSECTGTIIKFYENTSSASVVSDARKTVSPVVSYTVDGKNYEFIGNYYSSDMKVGQEVKIMYQNEDHSKATLKSGLYVAPIILGGLTLLFTLAYITCIILKRKGHIYI